MATSANIARRRLETGDHVSLEIEQEDEDLISSIKVKMERISSARSIFRVPDKLRRGNETLYDPGKLSIGPLHHGKVSLEAMEARKWKYLCVLLNRRPNLEASLENCVKALRGLEQRARRCYEEEIKMTSDEFVAMMLVDGCFTIEILMKYAVRGLRLRSDTIFTAQGMLFDLRCDMILQENQIPLFVLRRLFEIVPIPRQCKQSLDELIWRFLRNMLSSQQEDLTEKLNQEANHLLDLIRHCYLPTYPRVQTKESGSRNVFESASKLHEAGIKFRKVISKSLLDIKFVDGVIEIPPLSIHQFTESLFANLIAFEQHYCKSHTITSYVFLMHVLMNSDNDVKLLHHHRILLNDDDKVKSAPSLFSKLCKDVTVEDFHYQGIFEQIDEYNMKKKMKRNWSTWLRSLLSGNHLQSRRSLLALVIVVLLLIFTFVGTFFSILSFTLHRR